MELAEFQNGSLFVGRLKSSAPHWEMSDLVRGVGIPIAE